MQLINGNTYYESYRKKLDDTLQDFSVLMYFNYLEILCMSKFNVTGINELQMYNEDLLRPLLRAGMGGFAKMPSGDFYTDIPVVSGITAYYNRPKYGRLINPLEETTNLIIGKEIAVGWNNYNHSPQMELLSFAKLFAEIDTSLSVANKNTRLTTIVPVHNSKDKEAYEKVFDEIYSGKPKTVVLDKAVERLLQDPIQSATIELTNPQHIDKMQYLSKLHDDLIRRLAVFHGLKMNTTGKMAQITTEELNESDSFSKIYTCQQMDLLKRYIDDINRIYELNLSVEYTEAWKRLETKEISMEEFAENVSRETLVDESNIEEGGE